MSDTQVRRPRSIARRLLEVVAVAGAAVLLVPGAASACQIDNDTPASAPYQVDVWFDCGIACGNYFWDIPPGESRVRPGTAGKAQAEAMNTFLGEGGVCEVGRVVVDAHGEVGVTVNGPGKDGIKWVSKGGNSWTDPIYHFADTAAKGNHPCDWRGTP